MEGSRPPVGLLAGGTFTRNVARVLRCLGRGLQGNMKLAARTNIMNSVGTRAMAWAHVTGEAHFVGLLGLLGIFILYGLHN